MGIYLRCCDGAMAQNILNVSYINVFIEHHSCKGMSEHIGCYLLSNTGLFHIVVNGHILKTVRKVSRQVCKKTDILWATVLLDLIMYIYLNNLTMGIISENVMKL